MMKVDIHENRSKLLRLLRGMNIPIDLVPQDIGDYNIEGKLYICSELKSAEDYVNSVDSGHLNNQLYQMATAYDRSLLLVHGDINRALMKKRLDRERYFQFLAGIVTRQPEEGRQGTISILNFPRIQDVANFLKTLHKIATSDDISRSLSVKKQKMPIVGRKLATIESFPNVRKKRAKSLKNRFKTIANICNASRKELKEVPRIGKRIADELYDYIHEE